MSKKDFVPQDLPSDFSKPGAARSHAPVPVLKAALGRKCPRCGEGKLFKNVLEIRERCECCDLDYAQVDTGDGPAVFVIFILGFLVVIGAVMLDFAYEPPIWVHLLIWLPVTVLGSIALLAPMKAGLIALQYKHKAAEGRLS